MQVFLYANIGKQNESNLPSSLYTIGKSTVWSKLFWCQKQDREGCFGSLHRLYDCEEWVGLIATGDRIDYIDLEHLLAVLSWGHFNN